MADTIENAVVIDPDPDADLSNADFGNTVAPEPAAKTAEPEAAKAAATDTPKRDVEGRFVAKEKPEDATAATAPEDATAAKAPEDATAATTPEDATAAKATTEGTETTEEGPMVPLSRFKEVVNQRNDLASKLSEAQKTHSQAQTEARDEMKETLEARDKLYEQVEALRADGDTKGAAKMQREIDDANQRIADIKATMVARQAAFVANENRAYDQMLERLESALPVMNPDAPEFDRTVVEEMEFQVQAYEKMGLPPTQALRRAALLIFREDPFAPRPPAAKTEAAPAAKAPEAPTPAKKPTNVAKNIDAANRTPPEVAHKSDSGDGKGTKSIYDMTDEEMAALPPTVLARMRGDVVA